MNVELPNGVVLEDVPEGTSKDEIMRKAVQSGLAVEADFGMNESQPELPMGSPADTVIEPIQAVAGSMANQAISGLRGIGSLISGDGSEAAANTVRESQESLPSFAPETQAGQKGLQTLGDIAQLGVDLVNFPLSGLAGLTTLLKTLDPSKAAETVEQVQDQGMGKTLGDSVFESTESPLAATAAYMAPDIAATVAGSKTVKNLANKRKAAKASATLIASDGKLLPKFESALKKKGIDIESVIDDVPDLPPGIEPEKAADLLVKTKLMQKTTDGAFSGKMLSGGKVVDDDLAELAVKQGISRGDIQMMKTANPETSAAALKMSSIQRRIKNNSRVAADMQPSDVIGQEAMKRVDHIRGATNKARAELDRIAKTNLAGQPVDTDSIAKAFKGALDDLEVDFDLNNPAAKINFKGSAISKDRAARSLVNDVRDILIESRGFDAQSAHKLKRQLDTMIDWRKSKQGSLTPKGEQVAKAVRRSLNEAIRKVDGDYAKVNDEMSRSIEALTAFDDAMGSKFNLLDKNAANKAGRELRKILSNYNIKDDMQEAVNQIDAVSKALGGDFKTDVKTLGVFRKTLEDKFGASMRGSFGGEIDSNVRRALRGQEGVKDVALDKVADKITDLRGINDAEAFRSIDQILKRNLQQ